MEILLGMFILFFLYQKSLNISETFKLIHKIKKLKSTSKIPKIDFSIILLLAGVSFSISIYWFSKFFYNSFILETLSIAFFLISLWELYIINKFNKIVNKEE